MDKTKLNVILDAVNASVITSDRKGIIIECNQATERLFGYRSDELLGNNVSMLMPTALRVGHDKYMENYLYSGKSNIIGTGRNVCGKRSDGEVFPLHLAVGKHDIDGVTQFTGIVHDLTDQNRIIETNTRLGNILDESLNEVYVFDAGTLAFSLVSRGALSNLGYRLEEMQHMTPLDIKPEFSLKSFQALIDPLLKGEQTRTRFETKHQRKDGSLYDVEISLNLSYNTEPPEFVAIVQDVTEKNTIIDAFRQAQKMESIGQLTGGIAHDFNNILTVISGNQELLQSTVTNQKQKEWLKDAQDATQMGARLTNRLLAFASRSKLSPEDINLNGLILSLAELMRRTLGKNIKLNTTLSPELWNSRVDASQLENALVNLAINARDAMPDGGTLTIETKNCQIDSIRAAGVGANAGEYVCVSVVDTGTGIEPDNIHHIFEPFFTTKASAHGSGLGLSMVYGFARQSGGVVDVESYLGDGSRFSILLPRSISAVQPYSAKSCAEHSTELPKKTILVVEDENNVLKLTVQRLEQMGHHVHQASNGFEAFELFKTHRNIDIVFTDMIMTNGMTGHELARKIRKIDEEIKILITSGYSEELFKNEGSIAEDITLLKKPYSSVELARSLKDLYTN